MLKSTLPVAVEVREVGWMSYELDRVRFNTSFYDFGLFLAIFGHFWPFLGHSRLKCISPKIGRRWVRVRPLFLGGGRMVGVKNEPKLEGSRASKLSIYSYKKIFFHCRGNTPPVTTGVTPHPLLPQG